MPTHYATATAESVSVQSTAEELIRSPATASVTPISAQQDRIPADEKDGATRTAPATPSKVLQPPQQPASQKEEELPQPQQHAFPDKITVQMVLDCFEPQHLDYQSPSEVDEERHFIHYHLNPECCCLFTSSLPPVSFANYVHRLMTYCRASGLCYVMAAGFCRRLEKVGLPITPRSVHRLYLASLVLAIKAQDDFFMQQKYYAQCGGVPVQDLNQMERQVFFLLGCDTGMTPEELARLCGTAPAPSTIEQQQQEQPQASTLVAATSGSDHPRPGLVRSGTQPHQLEVNDEVLAMTAKESDHPLKVHAPVAHCDPHEDLKGEQRVNEAVAVN